MTKCFCDLCGKEINNLLDTYRVSVDKNTDFNYASDPNTDEYIKRAVAVKAVLRERKPTNSVAQNRMLSIIQRDLLTMPAADVAPVVHGRWVFGGDCCVICSECNEEESNNNHRNYCPNCGAKMDGGAAHETD